MPILTPWTSPLSPRPSQTLIRNTRADYEIDFAAVYNKVTMLGATIDPLKYLYPQPILNAKL
jgi:hypothetical protein